MMLVKAYEMSRESMTCFALYPSYPSCCDQETQLQKEVD